MTLNDLWRSSRLLWARFRQ